MIYFVQFPGPEMRERFKDYMKQLPNCFELERKYCYDVGDDVDSDPFVEDSGWVNFTTVNLFI